MLTPDRKFQLNSLGILLNELEAFVEKHSDDSTHYRQLNYITGARNTLRELHDQLEVEAARQQALVEHKWYDSPFLAAMSYGAFMVLAMIVGYFSGAPLHYLSQGWDKYWR